MLLGSLTCYCGKNCRCVKAKIAFRRYFSWTSRAESHSTHVTGEHDDRKRFTSDNLFCVSIRTPTLPRSATALHRLLGAVERPQRVPGEEVMHWSFITLNTAALLGSFPTAPNIRRPPQDFSITRQPLAYRSATRPGCRMRNAVMLALALLVAAVGPSAEAAAPSMSAYTAFP